MLSLFLKLKGKGEKRREEKRRANVINGCK